MTRSHHIKLGILTLVTLAAVIATGIGLGLHAMRVETIAYHTYFDESVQGLDLGAPVSYRGVRIGSVTAVSVAPDRKRVDVELGIDAPEAHRLALASVGPALRARLATQGITGVKMIDLDFVDPKSFPLPALGFPPGPHYIPARPSLVKSVEDVFEAISARIPGFFDRGSAALDKLQRLVDDVRAHDVPERFAAAVDQIGGTAKDLRRLVQHVDRAALPEHATETLARLDRAVDRAEHVLEGFDGEHGLVASARRATDSIGDVARAVGSSDAIEQAIREVGDAARGLRELVDEIQRDPDMLVKGRARTHKP